jgi:hypothetical protein
MLDIKAIFDYVADDCVAIYYGGSRVDPVIDNPHDYDYICFAKRLRSQRLRQKLVKAKLAASGSISKKEREKQLAVQSQDSPERDFSQIRVVPYTQITWFSYLDSLMTKVMGEDVCPKTDIISEHRAEFIECLKTKAKELIDGKILNQKRWYHLLRGVYILQNNSYEVTEEQRREINILHDLTTGYEQVRNKTIKLIETIY